MKKIRKHLSDKMETSIAQKMEQYSLLAKMANKINYAAQPFKASNSFSSLKVLIGLTASSLSPALVQSQCLINASNIDIDGDQQADLFIFTASYFQGYAGRSNNIRQYRIYGLPGKNVQFLGSGLGTPRSCYFNNCLFPYANGATMAPNSGEIGVLFSSINSCIRSYNTSQICSTTSYGGSTCFTTFVTSSNCLPTVRRGNFQVGVKDTLAVSVDGNFHFLELTLGPVRINSIDYMPAEPCNSTGCFERIILEDGNVFLHSDYHANRTIQTNNTVNETDEITLKAGEFIRLTSGFNAKEGSQFHASIEDCMPSASKIVQPTNLLTFKAVVQATKATLEWSVQESAHNLGFELQRSIDGVDFRKIAWLPTKGNGQHLYAFDDKNIQANTKYFYRLQQIDIANQSTYSDIEEAIVIQNDRIQVGEFSPNPVKYNIAKIAISSPIEQSLHVEIYDIKGIQLKKQNIFISKGNNIVDVEVADFPSGTYYTKMEVGSDRFYKSLIVVK